MRFRTIFISIGFCISAAVSGSAMPIRYQVNQAPTAVGQFTIDVPSGDAEVPFTMVTATDIAGTTGGLPWVSVFYTRNNGLALLTFIPTDSSETEAIGFFAAGSDLIVGWSTLASQLGLQVVGQAVPDSGATASLLALGVGGLALMRRRIAA